MKKSFLFFITILFVTSSVNLISAADPGSDAKTTDPELTHACGFALLTMVPHILERAPELRDNPEKLAEIAIACLRETYRFVRTTLPVADRRAMGGLGRRTFSARTENEFDGISDEIAASELGQRVRDSRDQYQLPARLNAIIDAARAPRD